MLNSQFNILKHDCSKYSKDAALLLVQRLDGRQTYDYRRIKISFGADYGCCFVELGETR